ncbi:MAG: hypothetical protein ACTHN0_20060 [Aquihabitans sp.]
MDIDPTALFLVWFGGGCVVFLIWAALVGQALMGVRLGAVRPAIGLLAVVGVLHPAAAVSAIDLARLTRTLATAPTVTPALPLDDEGRRLRAEALALPGWAFPATYACGAASAAVAVAALFAAGGVP